MSLNLEVSTVVSSVHMFGIKLSEITINKTGNKVSRVVKNYLKFVFDWTRAPALVSNTVKTFFSSGPMPKFLVKTVHKLPLCIIFLFRPQTPTPTRLIHQ